jgi:hypothetical protein
MGIGRARRYADARHGRQTQPVALRQTMSPIAPNAGPAKRQLPVRIDALRPLAPDGFLPQIQ